MKIPKGARVETFVEVEPSVLVEISTHSKNVRETRAMIFSGASRWTDAAAAHHRELFPVTSTFYGIGCEGNFYFQSHAGHDGTSHGRSITSCANWDWYERKPIGR